MNADFTSVMGPSLAVEVAAAHFADESPWMDPLPIPGETLQVLLVDFNVEVKGFTLELTDFADMDGILHFKEGEPSLISYPPDLISAAHGCSTQDEPERSSSTRPWRRS